MAKIGIIGAMELEVDALKKLVLSALWSWKLMR